MSGPTGRADCGRNERAEDLIPDRRDRSKVALMVGTVVVPVRFRTDQEMVQCPHPHVGVDVAQDANDSDHHEGDEGVCAFRTNQFDTGDGDASLAIYRCCTRRDGGAVAAASGQPLSDADGAVGR